MMIYGRKRRKEEKEEDEEEEKGGKAGRETETLRRSLDRPEASWESSSLILTMTDARGTIRGDDREYR